MTPGETLLVAWATLVTYFLISQYPLSRYAFSVLDYVGAIFQAYKVAVVSVSGDLPASLHVLGVGLNIASFALYLIPLWSFLMRAKNLGALTRDTNQLVRRVAHKLDLADARKIASLLSRKDLHRITENSLRRRMKHVQTRLDATHFKLVQQEMLNNTLATTNSEFQAQLDAAASRWQDKEKTRDETISKARNQMAAQDQTMNKLREENSELSTKVKALQQKKDEEKEAKGQYLLDVASKEGEMQELRSQHATELAKKASEIKELHNSHSTSAASKDAEMEVVKAKLTQKLTATATEQQTQLIKQAQSLTATNTELRTRCDKQQLLLDQSQSKAMATHADHQSAIAQKNDELRSLRSDHQAALAIKDNAMRKAQELLDSSIAGKDAEIQNLRKQQETALASKGSEISALQSRIDASEKQACEKIRELEDKLSTAKQVHAGELRDLHASYKSQMQSHNSEDRSSQELDTVKKNLNILDLKYKSQTKHLDKAAKESETVANEWDQFLGAIELIGSQVPRVCTEIGKKLYPCSEEISQLIKSDEDCYSVALQIRRARYNIETVWEHHYKFLRAFGRELTARYPDVAALSKSVTDKLLPAVSKASVALPPAQSQPNVITSKTVTASTPKSNVPLPLIGAKCFCGFQFLSDESLESKQDHLDRCEDFQRADQASKDKTLNKVGLGPVVLKQNTSRQEEITCLNCKRIFASSASSWFYHTHLKSRLLSCLSFSNAAYFTSPLDAEWRITGIACPEVDETSFQPLNAFVCTFDTGFLKSSGGLMGRSKYADDSYVPKHRERGQLIEKRV
ncbi:hypothetical protein SNOG_08600 [Parastagonospora nodorum SN15]|uniref:Uncharacterized protein n=1 Tax=Phaeosphaeria nodorum (strain SN15 / ATCC MYA-4574 / FGSC 10173) TaxID=321614 RepID=Q0UI14_PHANO|nr:hypothetical protein SNOG_08600 [Parastagonospora nodorum SN15]EAT83768.2 hypothetical protein SNOG_08600 [Parastagonospora nodorum SN15]